jgi:predicted DsbA family dithiol-disulfide isomerase
MAADISSVALLQLYGLTERAATGGMRTQTMSNATPRLTVTSYVDVISSWCYWAAPAWQDLQERYAGRAKFQWKIALMDASGLPTSHPQMDWFYRRSGMMMRSPVMLKSAWHQVGQTEYLAPNAIAEAARELGATDERVWLALARAGLLEGQNTGDWNIAAEIAAPAAGIDKAKLLERARTPEIETRLRASTAEFHAMQVNQRPTFVVDSTIGDRALFSGFAKAGPISAAIDSMLDDLVFYDAHAAHFGAPPA